MTKALILSCSLNPASRSARLARCAFDWLSDQGASVESIDLRDHPLPICDGATA